MAPRTPRALAAFGCFAVLAAGCVEPGAGPAAGGVSAPQGAVDPAVQAPDGRDLRTQLQKTDEIQPSAWHVGDWFGHHVFFGADDAEGRHYNTVVVEDRGTSWYLATDEKQAAKEEAVYDLPILGEIQKANLAMTGLGVDWDLYEFPLKDGKQWKREIELPSADFTHTLHYAVTFTTRFEGAIETPNGTRPGFGIDGVTDDGKTLYEYDYVPDIAWYAHFYLYDLESGRDDDWIFHSMSMGHGVGWTGVYYVDSATPLTMHTNSILVTPEYQEAKPSPYDTFTVAAGTTYIFGFVYSFAYAGVHETVLVDPNHQEYEFRAVGVPEGGGEFGFMDLPAVVGEWQIVTVGAGLAAVGGAHLWGVVETTANL